MSTFAVLYVLLLGSLVLLSSFLPLSSLAQYAAVQRWLYLCTNDGQLHGGAENTNKSTGAPWQALPINHCKKFAKPRRAKSIILTDATPLGKLETSSPTCTARVRFIRNTTFHPPTINNNYNEYEAHVRRLAAANKIILPPPPTKHPPLQKPPRTYFRLNMPAADRRARKLRASVYDVTPDHDTPNSRTGSEQHFQGWSMRSN